MMPFVVGKDAETNELIVGDRERNVFFLRGPAVEETAIRGLVLLANEKNHQQSVSAPQRLYDLLDRLRDGISEVRDSKDIIVQNDIDKLDSLAATVNAAIAIIMDSVTRYGKIK